MDGHAPGFIHPCTFAKDKRACQKKLNPRGPLIGRANVAKFLYELSGVADFVACGTGKLSGCVWLGIGLTPGKIAKLAKLKKLGKLKDAKYAQIHTKLENIRNRELNQVTLIGAQRELKGEVVGIDPKTGTPWDHVKKVRQGQSGLMNLIDIIKRELTARDLSFETAAALVAELGEASRLLTYSRKYVP